MSKEIFKKDKKDIEENKVIAAISYIFLLCLIPLLTKKQSKFAQFHAKQGLIITIIWFVIWIIGIIPVLGWILSFTADISLLVISVIGIIKTLDGEYWKIPYIYTLSKKVNL